jgi:hypothetical protein
MEMSRKLVVCLILAWVFSIMENSADRAVKQIITARVTLDIIA